MFQKVSVCGGEADTSVSSLGKLLTPANHFTLCLSLCSLLAGIALQYQVEGLQIIGIHDANNNIGDTLSTYIGSKRLSGP